MHKVEKQRTLFKMIRTSNQFKLSQSAISIRLQQPHTEHKRRVKEKTTKT